MGLLTFWDPGLLSRTGWLVAIALIPAGLAWLWWTLSRMVGSARRGDPFTHRNARRLAVAGALVALAAVWRHGVAMREDLEGFV